MKAENEKAARQLQDVRQWAKDKIAVGAEPPWAWYQYMKLIEAADAILSGMDCSITMESSQQSAAPLDVHLRLVDPICQQDVFPHRSSGLPVQMPM